MEDSADLRRGPPLVSASGRQVSCWPSSTDMHYQLGSNTYASGSGSSSNNAISRLNSDRMDEANETRQGGRVCGQDTGKGPDYSTPATNKSSKLSTKHVTTRSSDIRRSHRSHNSDRHTETSMKGGSSLVRSSDLMNVSGARRSPSPVVSSSRNGSTSSPRRNENHGAPSALGERVSHRYLGGSSRGLASGSSNAASFGGIGNESRLRLRNLSNSSADAINSPTGAAAHAHSSQNAQQGATNPRVTSVPSHSRLPPHPPVARSRHIHSSTNVPSISSPSSGPAPSRLPPSPPSGSSSLSSALEMLPTGSSSFHSSFLPRTSSSGEARSERGLASAAESLLGMPFRGLHSASDGDHPPRLVAEGLAEILMALERVERDEDLTYEQLLMLEATLLFGGMGLHDQHSDMRLDVDNMSYEELLALEERIGNVNTGVNADIVNKRLKRSKYSSHAVALSSCSQESDMKCSICQEEYEEGDELGKIDCGHNYHVGCIKQWLVQKNQCPICKASALSS